LGIKAIVAKANEGESVFFLLDEILKGTNSVDRHLGTKILIRKLCSTKSIGLVSTTRNAIYLMKLAGIDIEDDQI